MYRCGVIGNTSDFDSDISSSSLDGGAKFGCQADTVSCGSL